MDTTAFQVHHFYYGIILMLVAFPFLFIAKRRRLAEKSWKWARRTFLILTFIGLIIYADDGYQHYRQIEEPAYTSPIHNIYVNTLYKVEWIQKLNQWADNLFRSKP